jgi:mannose-6-phosphate isomerase-like protein (cupin superfamily)
MEHANQMGSANVQRCMSHRIVDVASFEGRRKPVGRTLEVRAFGINQFDSSPEQAGFEQAGSGQEEVYVALAGSGEIRIGSESVPLAPGRYVLVPPGVRRQVIAGSEGLSYLAVGGVPPA